MAIRLVVKTIFLGLMLLCSISGAQAGIFSRLNNYLRDQSFIRAVIASDFTKVQKKMGEGVNVNTLKKSKSALMYAVENNNLAIFNLILSAEPRLNLQDKAGETAVYKAVKVNNLEMLKILIAKGANTNLRLYSGDSPLALAKRRGQINAIRILENNASLFATGNCQFIKESKNAPDKSVNLVFVPSAFNGDMELFRKESERIWKIFSSYAVFNSKIEVLNVAFAFTENNESNNFCDFNCNGIERLLCCNISSAKKLSSSCMTEDKQTIVVHNSKKYGGAGYLSSNVATTSIHQEAPKVAIHELGHSLFHLADEYTYGDGTSHSARNCAPGGCKRWQDLLDLGLATCQDDGCSHGKYFTNGDTIMKSLGQDFGNVNERLACCAYKNSSGGYPDFCQKFLMVGRGIDSYCRLKVEEENKKVRKQFIFAPVEMEFTKDNKGNWQLFSHRASQRPGHYPLEMVQGGSKIEVETATGIKTIRTDNNEDIEYIPAEDVEHIQTAKIIKIQRNVLKIVIDGLDTFHLSSQEKSLEDLPHDLKIKIDGEKVY